MSLVWPIGDISETSGPDLASLDLSEIHELVRAGVQALLLDHPPPFGTTPCFWGWVGWGWVGLTCEPVALASTLSRLFRNELGVAFYTHWDARCRRCSRRCQMTRKLGTHSPARGALPRDRERLLEVP